MAKLWRLCKAKHAAAALSGEGARRYGGRWHSAGTPLVYAADSLALAALEVLVHVQSPQAFPAMVAIAIEVPDDALEVAAPDDLPQDWNRLPPAPASQALGDAWHRSGRSLALSLPSVIVPAERIVLIHPGHARFTAIVVQEPRPFTLDPRLAPP
ncbi:MAG: RES family NAD+ phosphorylase [Deltaproteobacteria bacterium]|nr:RES family NAD+ phosphorylase [Deltaproteobacteria bacterium]